MEMRLTFNKMADAAYIYFKDISDGEVKTTISLNESVNVDLDGEGRTLGIEILEASRNLPIDALKSATTI